MIRYLAIAALAAVNVRLVLRNRELVQSMKGYGTEIERLISQIEVKYNELREKMTDGKTSTLHEEGPDSARAE